MTPGQAKLIQTRIGVIPDGALGRGSFTALFSLFGAAPVRAHELGLSAVVNFPIYGMLDTPLRLVHFMAQLIHESGSFRYMEEIASGQAYEGRADLGNTVPGDGPRFKGRGPIQLTGRANYRAYGQAVGIDFESHPEIVAMPSIGLMVGCRFWQTNGLNQLADADDLERITRRINGGLNGLDDRKAQLIRMKALML